MNKILLFFAFMIGGITCLNAQLVSNEGFKNFQQETGAIISLNRATAAPNFIRMLHTKPLRLSGHSLQEKATDFLQSYGDILGIKNTKKELKFMKTQKDKIGFHHLTFQQRYHNIPVFDGKVILHFDKKERLRSVNTVVVPEIAVNPNPTITSEEAAAIAQESLREVYQTFSAPLRIRKNNLCVYHTGMARGTNGPVHLAYEIELRNDAEIREFLFVDAHKGTIVEQYSAMCHALSRRLYERSTDAQVWQEGDAFPSSLDQWQQNELVAAGQMYHLANNAFGYASYDGADAEMKTINNNPHIACPNATWNGTTANYCTGTATDDVVAHEWGHAYTEHTCNLIYQWQAGALNESYSDVWGETVDLLNNYEDDDENLSIRTTDNCGESTRWKMGEDATAFNGAIRDMWSPTCFGDPGKVTDSEYHCATTDHGGVHSNSGVPNHAYALLVDGGTYNNQTINGIGIVKAAHIWWRVQKNYLTATSDFSVFADALEAAGADLVGLNLEGLSFTDMPAGPSGEIITTADLEELAKVILATELRVNPDVCNFTPILTDAPDLCAGAEPVYAIYYEDFEDGLGDWTVSQQPVFAFSWTDRDWIVKDELPRNRVGHAAYGIDPLWGDCANHLESGIIRLESPVIQIPSTAVDPVRMTFDHYIATEFQWDGGNIKYSLDGGAWTLLPETSFTTNPYNTVMKTAASGNDNPLEGQVAFSGTDEGTLSGSWSESHLDLSTIGVAANSNVQFRWEMGTDGCNGNDGWYIDNISIFDCSIPAISFDTEVHFVNENQANSEASCLGYYEYVVYVNMDGVPSQPVAVTIDASGTATGVANKDYSFFPMNFELSASNLTQAITVRVYNDALVERQESVTLTYDINNNGGNAFVDLVGQSHTLIIEDDDREPSESIVIVLQEDFENGMNGFSTVTTGTTGYMVGDATSASSSYWTIENANATKFAYINDDACNCDLSSAKLISRAFDLSAATVATLTFEHAFSNINGESCDIMVSTDGGTTWSGSVFGLSNTSTGLSGGSYRTPWVDSNTVDLSDFAGNNNVILAFEYKDSGQWLYGAAVDNIVVTAGKEAEHIHTTVNTATPDEQYLGPNETIHYYDPMTGNIMLSIENLTDFDYGCTSVSLNREGTGAEQAWDTDPMNFIASKTFMVTPTHDSPAGLYNVSLYYTAAEIDGWEAVTGRVPTDLVVIKSEGDLTNPVLSDGRAFNLTSTATFGEGYVYRATFSGLSQLGIGPAEEDDGITCEENIVSSTVRDNDTILVEVRNNISSTEIITGATRIDYSAGMSIDLLPGFSVDSGTVFHAYILGCFSPRQGKVEEDSCKED